MTLLLILRLEFANFKVIRLVGQNLSGEVRPLKEVNPSIGVQAPWYMSTPKMNMLRKDPTIICAETSSWEAKEVQEISSAMPY